MALYNSVSLAFCNCSNFLFFSFSLIDISPFALLNDEGGEVDFYLEQALYESKFVNFHPLINTFTITIETNKFIEFMIENYKKIHIFSSLEGKIFKTYGK